MTKHRTCIKCHTDMLPQMVHDVEVDICPNCGGLWLDRDEIRALSEKSDAQLSDLRAILNEAGPKKPTDRSTVEEPCPACGAKMTLAHLGPINIEHCPSCDGIYLDKGELDRAIETINTKDADIATIAAMANSVFTSGSIGD